MLQLRLRARAAATLLAIVAVLFALTVPPAHAQTPMGVEVTSASLVKSNANGVVAREGEQAQLYVGDLARATISFRVLEPMQVQAGDTLTVTLPDEVNQYRSAPFAMYLDRDAATQVAICQPEERAIVCTANEEFAQRAGDQANGEIWFVVSVAQLAEPTEFVFQVNDAAAAAAVPLGVKERVRGYQPQRFDKVSTPITPQHRSIPWSVRFNGGTIAEELGVAFDGRTVHTIEFEDRPDPARQVLPAAENYRNVLGSWALAEANTEEQPTQQQRALAKVGASLADGFTMDVKFAGDEAAIITLTGPFRADANYTMSAHMPIREEFHDQVCGFDYRNDVTLLGPNLAATSAAVRCGDAGGGRITLAPGFGSVKVTKTFDNPDNVPAEQYLDAEYQVKVKYAFPAGGHAADYQVEGRPYAAPGTLNADGTGGEALITLVGKDGTLAGELAGMLPAGTAVELVEVLPRVAGIVWKAPIIEPQRFDIVSMETTEARLVNGIQKVTGDTAPVKIFKKVEGDLPNPPQFFDFLVQCEGSPDRDVRVQVNKETGVGTFEVGKKCTVTEKDSTVPEGYRWDKPVTQTVEIPREGYTFQFVNTYVRDHGNLGHFTLTKIVEAEPGVAVPSTFDFAYRCERDDTDDVFTGKLEKVAPNTPTQSPGVPEGFTCAVTEMNADVEGADLQLINPGTVKVGENITITNVYKRIVPLDGTFTVKKIVKAEPGMNVPDTFHFDYRCTKPGEQDILGKVTGVKAGATGSSARIPEGYQCTVTERDASIDGADWTLKVSGEVAAGDVATVTNTYTRPDGSVLRQHSSLPWWILGIPLLGGLARGATENGGGSAGGGDTPAGAAPQATATHNDVQPAPAVNAKTVGESARPSVLASTGASVLGVVVLAAIAVAVGVFLIRRNKK